MAETAVKVGTIQNRSHAAIHREFISANLGHLTKTGAPFTLTGVKKKGPAVAIFLSGKGDDQESGEQRESDGPLLSKEGLGLLVEQAPRRKVGSSRLPERAIS